jgi:plasmid stabilization system protein ParE
MRVVWTEEAVESFLDIKDFLSATWNEMVVEEFSSRTDKTVNMISKNPSIGTRFGADNDRRVIIHPHVSLFYEVNKETIVILLLWDNRQDPFELLNRLKR